MIEINNELVRKLIKGQFPEWVNLPISPVEKSGHDNRTFHLGEKMSVRLPSGREYAPQVQKELMWLPKLKPHLSLPISAPMAAGHPTGDYPFPWSINQWINGETVTYDNVKNLNQFAIDLAKFLKKLQVVDTFGGPIAGSHNFHRGGLLSVYNEETQVALKSLKSLVPVNKLNNIWSMALRSKWRQKNVWIHGDIAPGNLLVSYGELCAVIDFGILGVGDPSCDYAIAWTFLDADSRNTFFKELECDEDTRDRARGWALWKALITYNDKNPVIAENAKHTIGVILDDYNRNE